MAISLLTSFYLGGFWYILMIFNIVVIFEPLPFDNFSWKGYHYGGGIDIPFIIVLVFLNVKSMYLALKKYNNKHH
jgi:hypothetical protein